jgi:hypothetical protein
MRIFNAPHALYGAAIVPCKALEGQGYCLITCALSTTCRCLALLQTLAGTGVAACQISTYYYVGFAYLMMRRYQDAIRTLSGILVYIQRTKQYHARSYQFDEVRSHAPNQPPCTLFSCLGCIWSA